MNLDRRKQTDMSEIARRTASCQSVRVRRYERAVVYHPLSLLTKQHHEHIHGITCTPDEIDREIKQVLGGGIFNRTYGTQETPIYFTVFTNNITSYLLWSPVIAPKKGNRNEK